MKACESCERVAIAGGFAAISPLRVFLGLIFIYGPIVFLPFILLPAFLVYVHLRLMGAKNLKTLGAFLPAPDSHRYRYKTQIVSTRGSALAFWTRGRLYWIFNCTWYCPFSIGVLEWFSYLVKVVENWWCPFAHGRKPDYAAAAIDHSFWHNPADAAKLHPADRANPIWNQDASAAPESASGAGPAQDLPTASAARPKVAEAS